MLDFTVNIVKNCNFKYLMFSEPTRYLPIWRVLVANSTPIVDLDSRLNWSQANLESRQDLPTPESPTRTTLNR